MLENGCYLRIQEGSYSYLLSTEGVESFESRQDEDYDILDEDALVLGFRLRDDTRVPIVKLSRLLRYPAGEWSHMVLFDMSEQPIGLAVEEVQLLSQQEVPKIQKYNPVGYHADVGQVIVGLNADRRTKELVLASASLYRGLQSAIHGNS